MCQFFLTFCDWLSETKGISFPLFVLLNDEFYCLLFIDPKQSTVFLKFEFFLHSPQVFSANGDKNTIIRQTLSPVIVARYIRIYPKSWHGGNVALRADFTGCLKGIKDKVFVRS